MELYYHDTARDVVILAADGGLNSDTAQGFIADLEKVAAAGIAKLIVDCSRLTFISSSGITALLRLHSRMKARGCDVRFAIGGASPGGPMGPGGSGSKPDRPRSLVLDTIRLAKLDRIFAIYPDVNAALLSLRPKDAVAKRDLRERARMTLAALPADEGARWSARICERLVGSDLVKPGATVMLYGPRPEAGEVDISALAGSITGAGGRVAVPRIDWAHGVMRPALVADFKADLVPDTQNPAFGLLSPRPEAPEIDPRELDAVILPGLAFDYSGNRLGRGAGYYDRFLADLPEDRPARIGVAFDVQLADTVPTDAHDIRLHALATPTLLLRFA